MAVYDSMESLIGSTPLLRMDRAASAYKAQGPIYGKLEMFNPTGSAKDRAALFMLQDAEARGILPPGGTVIEPTSGNTGIGLAAVGVARGYRVIVVMPDSMSRERIRLISAYGAEVVLTPGALGMKGAIEKAESLSRELGGAFIAGQFGNPANPRSHECTTGPELYSDLQGRIGAFVAGAGTGGTLTGTARYLKAMDPSIRIVAVEPAASPLLTRGVCGPHGLQGIGANFVPENLDLSLIDEIIPVSDEDAFAAAKAIARREGLLTGITSGAAFFASVQVSRALPGKNIVALLPDNGDRYLSTGLYD